MTKIQNLFKTFKNLNFEFVSDLGFRASDLRQRIPVYALTGCDLCVTYFCYTTLARIFRESGAGVIEDMVACPLTGLV
jgi:hypothetical protein